MRQPVVVGVEVRQRGLLLGHPEAGERAPFVLAHPPRPAGLAGQRVGERADLGRALAERQRLDEALAEARVGQPALAVEVDQQRHVVRRPLAADDRLVVGDDEPAPAQQRRQDRVELEAVAAAAVGAHPRGQRGLVERAGLRQLHRDVLVRDPRQVRAVQLEQPVDGRLGPRREPDPPQQRVGHWSPPLSPYMAPDPTYQGCARARRSASDSLTADPVRRTTPA